MNWHASVLLQSHRRFFSRTQLEKMDRRSELSLALICIIVAGVGVQSPAAAPSKSPETLAATTPAPLPAEAPSRPKSPAPAVSPKSALLASSPKASSPAASPSNPENKYQAPTPVSSTPPAPVPVSSPPALVTVRSPGPASSEDDEEGYGSAMAVVEHDQVSSVVPVMEARKMEVLMLMNEGRRKLGSFQICALCTCCGGTKGVCLPSPCCYAINCNIPNRPFGFCSFTPKTCNCFGCHL